MAVSKPELRRLEAACAKLEDGPSYRCRDYVTNLNNLALDFQMKSASVTAAMDYFDEMHHVSSHRRLRAMVDAFPNTKLGNRRLARHLWSNNHWSRAKFLREILECFEKRGIHGQKSLERWVKTADFKRDVQGQFRTAEHSIGYALFQWLKLRLGVETVKPDVHVMRFVSEAIGTKVSAKDAVNALERVAARLNRKPSLLDAAIWLYQRERVRHGVAIRHQYPAKERDEPHDNPRASGMAVWELRLK